MTYTTRRPDGMTICLTACTDLCGLATIIIYIYIYTHTIYRYIYIYVYTLSPMRLSSTTCYTHPTRKDASGNSGSTQAHPYLQGVSFPRSKVRPNSRPGILNRADSRANWPQRRRGAEQPSRSEASGRVPVGGDPFYRIVTSET